MKNFGKFITGAAVGFVGGFLFYAYLQNNESHIDPTNYFLKNVQPDSGCYDRDPLVCKDGFIISIQASEVHYCNKCDNSDKYKTVEIDYISKEEPELLPYCEDTTLYYCVPVEIVNRIIRKHGGIDHINNMSGSGYIL